MAHHPRLFVLTVESRLASTRILSQSKRLCNPKWFPGAATQAAIDAIASFMIQWSCERLPIQPVDATVSASISGRRPIAECLAGPGVALARNRIQLRLGVAGEVSPLRQVLAQQTIGVLVRPALPRTVRVAEIDLHDRWRSRRCDGPPVPDRDPRSAWP